MTQARRFACGNRMGQPGVQEEAMTDHVPAAPPLPPHLTIHRSGPAWAWWFNGAAATALVLMILALGARVVRYINTADDHLEYEALGFAQLFGVLGLILLAPVLICAVIAALCAAARNRAAFVLNIVAGFITMSVAGGLSSHQWAAVIPAAAIATAIAGWVAVANSRRAG